MAGHPIRFVVVVWASARGFESESESENESESPCASWIYHETLTETVKASQSLAVGREQRWKWKGREGKGR